MLRLPLTQSDVVAALVIAAVAGAAAVGIRQAGALERIDFAFNDILSSSTRSTVPADGFLIVLESEADRAKWGGRLAEDKLTTLLEKISAAQPLAIGIDGQRDRAATSDRIFTSCADLVRDRDGAVRRTFIYRDGSDRGCYSLGFQLARRAASTKGQAWSITNGEPPRLVLGAARMRPLDPGDGPYASIDAAGFQVAIPTSSGIPAFDTASFEDVMEGRVDPARIRDRIVLVGSNAATVRLQALVAAHLLDVAQLRSEPLLLLHGVDTAIATGVLALLMSIIACARRRPARVIMIATVVIAMYVLSAFALAAGAILFAPTAPLLAMVLALAVGLARSAWLVK
jgi:CHASE2 domain-containing sensor protein